MEGLEGHGREIKNTKQLRFVRVCPSPHFCGTCFRPRHRRRGDEPNWNNIPRYGV